MYFHLSFFKTLHTIKHQALCEWLYRMAAAKTNEDYTLMSISYCTSQAITYPQPDFMHYQWYLSLWHTIYCRFGRRWNKYLAWTAFDKPVVITDWLQQTCFWYTESAHTISDSSSTHSCDRFGHQQLQLIYYSTCLRTWHK